MNYEFGYSMLFLEIIGFVAEFCGKVARSVYAAWHARFVNSWCEFIQSCKQLARRARTFSK